MNKQTFEVLPQQGVYWKEKALKLTFGMSVAEFDDFLPDFCKKSSWQKCQLRYSSLFHADFDENDALQSIMFFESFPVRVVFDGVDLFTKKNVVKWMISKNPDVWEENLYPSLEFPDPGIAMSQFHQSDGEHEKTITVFKEFNSEYSHPYPPPPLRKFGEFHLIPGKGIHEPKLGDIKFGDTWEALVPNWKGFFPAWKMTEKVCDFGREGFSINFGKENSCCEIMIDTDENDFFIGRIKVGRWNWKKRVIALSPKAYYLNDRKLLFCPELSIIFQGGTLSTVYVCTPAEFSDSEQYFTKLFAKDKIYPEYCHPVSAT